MPSPSRYRSPVSGLPGSRSSPARADGRADRRPPRRRRGGGGLFRRRHAAVPRRALRPACAGGEGGFSRHGVGGAADLGLRRARAGRRRRLDRAAPRRALRRLLARRGAERSGSSRRRCSCWPWRSPSTRCARFPSQARSRSPSLGVWLAEIYARAARTSKAGCGARFRSIAAFVVGDPLHVPARRLGRREGACRALRTAASRRTCRRSQTRRWSRA